MKLRIKGNSIRLRLSQTEVATFSQKGIVEEKIAFGQLTKDAMVYSLKKSESNTSFATYSSEGIMVFVPNKEAENWVNTDQVGIEGSYDLGNGDVLKILVEKDFQCLKVRPGEDESDNFPNPDVGVIKC